MQFHSTKSFLLAAATFASGFSLLLAAPALAHHAMGETLPSNFFEGFLSGVAHPIIGVDHFAAVVAVGLLAAGLAQGIMIPIAFVLTSLLGTGIHLMQVDMPLPEFFVAVSVVLFGIFLVVKQRPNAAWIGVLAAIAGIFHGYAYGESILGAEPTPLVAYLTGFALIQTAIAAIAYQVARSLLKPATETSLTSNSVRSVGFVICGVGLTVLAAALGA
ncbi:MAG TPA: HupE/UreJ family protein [Leptolyngbyaceae cyanobacterium M33_DOE_097]|uniref:HupE/UreJ family protein n=1 Tax=Oscillatoriales cyanobacterium SpSt-418 TaxID=2282169 RepID=A0A7C3PFS0_9CYAN|nr:HupE/UreJ family protein [Leptolyngbyaceae cyanobacterium M33_DOE_097]